MGRRIGPRAVGGGKPPPPGTDWHWNHDRLTELAREHGAAEWEVELLISEQQLIDEGVWATIPHTITEEEEPW